jgi:hypothetical protein
MTNSPSANVAHDAHGAREDQRHRVLRGRTGRVTAAFKSSLRQFLAALLKVHRYTPYTALNPPLSLSSPLLDVCNRRRVKTPFPSFGTWTARLASNLDIDGAACIAASISNLKVTGLTQNLGQL